MLFSRLSILSSALFAGVAIAQSPTSNYTSAQVQAVIAKTDLGTRSKLRPYLLLSKDQLLTQFPNRFVV